MLNEEPKALDRLRRKFEREKRARESAEMILEQKAFELFEINQSLAREKEFFKRTLRTVKDAVICLDMAGNIELVNRAAERICEAKEVELIGRPLLDCVSLFTVGESTSIIPCIDCSQPTPLPDEAVITGKLGHAITVEISSEPLFDTNNKRIGLVIALEDITDTQAMLMRLNRLSNYDAMTSLPNRRYFVEILTSHIASSQQHGRSFALLSIDINNFKRVNAWLGQERGDQAIERIAKVLTECIRQEDILCRLNGDEFAILLADISTREDAESRAQYIIDKLESIQLSRRHSLTVSSAVGISLYPQHGDDSSTLLFASEAARMIAKQPNGHPIQVFTDALADNHKRYIAIEKVLNKEAFADHLSLFLQPKWHIDNSSIYGAEVLLRGRLDDIGPVSPVEVINVAEETGSIIALGWWIIDQACQMLSRFHLLGHKLTLAVNVSAMQLASPDFAEHLVTLVNKSEISPEYLVLEITESVMLDDPASSKAILARLKQAGFCVSIDDFGTGYSSYAYLQHLEVQELKIDKSFVDELMNSSESEAIVASILTLAKGLQLNVVAEGIEHESQRSVLEKLGCQHGQGYLVSPPLPADDFISLLKRQT